MEKSILTFKPYFKKVIWGGNKIFRLKGLPASDSNIGESWEISALPGFESIVAEGPYAGKTISELIEKFREQLVGEAVWNKYGNRFPLLFKIIDATDNLSLQVHPDDELAAKRHGCNGKTEMWYIIETDKDSKIYAGFKNKISPEEYEVCVSENTLINNLAVYDSKPGDVYFLPAGRVHAIGAGNLLIEIQEASDITYRIFDYNRTDENGNKRELHTELAKEAINFEDNSESRISNFSENWNNPHLISCLHFTTRKIDLEGTLELYLDNSSFTVLMCVSGEAKIFNDNQSTILKEGNTVLIPASINHVTLEGNGTILQTRSI